MTVLHFHLCEVAVRAGRVHDARRLLSTWDDWGIEELLPGRQRALSMLAAVVGDADQAVEIGTAALPSVELRGWDRLEIWRALGLAALLKADPERAVAHFSDVWDYTQREGVGDPGVFPVAGDLVEVLLDLERFDDARDVTAKLADQAEAQDHPWGLATVARSRALITLNEGYDEQACQSLVASANAFAGLGLHFDRARTLLAVGRIQRRYRKWGAARESLTEAAAAFNALGSHGWAERVNSELSRVGGRRPAGEGHLTVAEERVVQLAAAGLSNKQIAAELVVTVHTVEVHLSRAYAKLQVNSRSQLVGALQGTTTSTPSSSP